MRRSPARLHFDYLRQRSNDLRDIAELLKTDKPLDRVEKLLSDMKDRDREIDVLKAKAASQNSSAVMDKITGYQWGESPFMPGGRTSNRKTLGYLPIV